MKEKESPWRRIDCNKEGERGTTKDNLEADSFSISESKRRYEEKWYMALLKESSILRKRSQKIMKKYISKHENEIKEVEDNLNICKWSIT